MRPIAFTIGAYLAIVGLVSIVLVGNLRTNSGDLNRLMNTSNSQSDTPAVSKSGYDLTPLTDEQIAEAAARLTEEERRVILNEGTEPAFCGLMHATKDHGAYICKLCELPLFASDHKFTSGTGWPSFYQPVDADHIRYKQDKSFGMVRTEIMCNRCGGHLGHVFEDGPKPTGLRYCLNSASLTFYKVTEPLPLRALPIKTENAYFAGGCFWGVEHHMSEIPGVIDVVSGYQGGHVENPTYKQVSYTDTGHTETVRVTFDPSKVTYRQLLEKFFWIHDARQLNRQGPDVGSQYRSAVFAVDEKQLDDVKTYIEEIQDESRFEGRPIVTELRLVEDAGPFYEAEDYHQDYHALKGGYCPVPNWSR